MSAAVIGRQLRQQQASARAAGPVVPPTQYKGRAHVGQLHGSNNSGSGGQQQYAHHTQNPGSAAGRTGSVCSATSAVHCQCCSSVKSHVVPSSSSGCLHGNLVRCLYHQQSQSQAHHQHDPNHSQSRGSGSDCMPQSVFNSNNPPTNNSPFCCSPQLPPYDLILPSTHTLPIIDIIDSPTANKHPFTVESYFNDINSRPLHRHRHSGVDANKKFAQFSALYTHHEFYPHPAHRENAQNRASRGVSSKDKKKSDEQNRRFHCTGHCFCVALKALSAGIVLLIIGTAMTLVGFFAERFPEDDPNYGAALDGTINSSSNDSSKSHLHNLTYVGPVIMGLGGIVLVAACILTFEVRDTLGTKRQHDLNDLDSQSPIDPEAPGSGSYLQVPDELLHKLKKVQQQQAGTTPERQSAPSKDITEKERPIVTSTEASKDASLGLIVQRPPKAGELKGNHFETSHVTTNLCSTVMHAIECKHSSLPVLSNTTIMHDHSTNPSSQGRKQICQRRTKCKHKTKNKHQNKHRSRRKSPRKAIAIDSGPGARKLSAYSASNGLWIPSPAETDLSDLDGCSHNPSPVHYRSTLEARTSSLHYLNVPVSTQLPSRDAKILASFESDGLLEMPSSFGNHIGICDNLQTTDSKSTSSELLLCHSDQNLLASAADDHAPKLTNATRTLSFPTNGLASQVSQV